MTTNWDSRLSFSQNVRNQFTAFHSSLRNMKFDVTEAKYISIPGDCTERNQMLKEVLGTQGQWVIWDLYGGVGGDAVQFQVLFPQCRLTVVQPPEDSDRAQGFGRLADTARRFGRLADRAQRFSRLANNVTLVPNTHTTPVCESNPAFVNSAQAGTHVDLVYCDPPWYADEKPLSAQAFGSLLQTQVLAPLSAKGIHPRFLCIKTMYPHAELSPHIETPGYQFQKEVCPARKKDKNNYFFILLESLQGGDSADELSNRCTATRFRVWW